MLIGLNGKAGSGKDQSYQFIQEWAKAQGRPVRRDAFADRLKLSAARALGFTGTLEEAVAFCNRLKGPDTYVGYFHKTADVYISGREYLQMYGTEAHREVFGTDFWVDPVIDNYRDHAVDEIFVVTDVRFPNEATAIRDCGGEIWQLLRPREVEIAGDHASEQPLPVQLIDHLVRNDQGLDHLRDLVQTRLERLVYA